MEDRSDDMPASKKRVAGREISRDNPGLDDDDVTPEETGSFKRATEEVLATRRIIKVKRNQPTSAPASNPFSSVCLVPPPADISATISSEAPAVPPSTNGKELPSEVDQVTVSEEIVGNTVDTEPAAPLASTDKLIEEQIKNVASAPEELSKTAGKSSETKNASDEPLVESTINAETDASASAVEVTGDVPEDVNGVAGETAKGTLDESDKVGEPKSGSAAAAPVNLFQELSGSQNAFTGFSGSGFSSQPFSFGTSASSFSFSSGSSAFSSGSASLFGSQLGNSSAPSFGFGNSFSPAGADAAGKSSETPKPVLHEVPVETGEEKEKAVFVADAVLFEYLDGGWKERGKGELKLNAPSEGIGKARLVMRSKGNLRLILNANLYPEMKLAPMDKRGVTFACVNSPGEGKAGLATFALKLKDGTLVEAFQEALNSHKGEQTQAPKTPENSPKTGDV